ncbi:hypothetical protein LOZ34_004915 [Ophidiomyces ophidiicola]|nr:hypothetical protein LOZ34_004915 [Ophidiomyces ophidiicola]KAI2215717.1 hypothetical protein LOZ17_004531 [Ophidiomyces ophidiicola]KAI2338453.1 hypothetical protein LOY98_001140 [Ophidiomyces ophidiicola]
MPDQTALCCDEQLQRFSQRSTVPFTKAKRNASRTSLRSEPASGTRALSRPRHQLQLSPFESLGIAHSSLSFTASRRPNDAMLLPPVMGGSSASSALSSSSLLSKPEHSYASPLPLTPPEIEDSFLWNPNSHSLFISDNHSSASCHNIDPYMEDFSAKETSDSDSGPEQEQHMSSLALQGTRATASPMIFSNRSLFPGESSDEWLQDALLPVVSSLPLPKFPGDSVQLVSQTLPCPPSDSSASALPKSAFTPIVKAIQNRLQTGYFPYISIVHAVPPKFSLSSLPTSPPSTPNLLFPGDDYFNNTVFSSAAAVPAYPYIEPTSFASPACHHTSTPIVPPFSVNVAVIERYLPPTSTQECQALFLNKGPSVLLDRLRELSPNGGNLLFIYPIKRGAETFRDKYLSPILDPLLRQLAVINGLSADIGNALGRIPSIAYMDEFEGMKARLQAICDSISSKTSPPGMSACHQTNFTLAYAGQATVKLDRCLWTEWYIQQETARARDIINHYWRKGHRLPENNIFNAAQRNPTSQEVTGASLLREILDGVRTRPYPDGFQPDCGLELGVFVIRRALS